MKRTLSIDIFIETDHSAEKVIKEVRGMFDSSEYNIKGIYSAEVYSKELEGAIKKIVTKSIPVTQCGVQWIVIINDGDSDSKLFFTDEELIKYANELKEEQQEILFCPNCKHSYLLREAFLCKTGDNKGKWLCPHDATVLIDEETHKN